MPREHSVQSIALHLLERVGIVVDIADHVRDAIGLVLFGDRQSFIRADLQINRL